MIDLKQFCSAERSRSYLNAPFSIGEFTYASDGHVAIRVPRVAGVGEADNAPTSIVKLFEDTAGLSFEPMPEIDIPASTAPRCKDCAGLGRVVKCRACNGNGNHDCDCEHCEENCDECDGAGFHPDRTAPDDMRFNCETCNGSGSRLDERDVVFPGELVIGARFISLVLGLPGPLSMAIRRDLVKSTYSSGPGDYLPQVFSFDGGLVLVMPKRYSKKENSIVVKVAAEAQA